MSVVSVTVPGGLQPVPRERGVPEPRYVYPLPLLLTPSTPLHPQSEGVTPRRGW